MAKRKRKHYRAMQRRMEELRDKNVVVPQEIANAISAIMMLFIAISLIKWILLLLSRHCKKYSH